MFVELKCKTNFSFLRGASHPEELVKRAIDLGYSALGITDYDGVYGMPKAYWAAKQAQEKNAEGLAKEMLKIIVGADLKFLNHPRITLLAQDRAAYGQLCRIITDAHKDKPKGEAYLEMQTLVDYMQKPQAKGIIALPDPNSDYAFLKEVFDENIYLPLSRPLDGFDHHRTYDTLEVSKKYDIPIIATNDVHYHDVARYRLQDVVTCIREKVSLNNSGYKLFSNGERYLKSPKQMSMLFADMPDAILLTAEIAESCTFSPKELRYRYPSEWIPKGYSAQSYLEELTMKGAKERYRGIIPTEVEKMIQHEMHLISKLDFADYFLTIYDIVNFAKSKKILCQGRGSAANSVVCYCLGITAVDPLRLNLLFERFISEQRGEPPDIDVDFEHERREEVIQYIYQKYGRDRAAMVSAVITYRTRSMIREIAKALDIDVGTLSAKEVQKNLEVLAKNSKIPNVKEKLEKISEEMYGFPRHLSIHSGGFTLSADPIVEIVPVEPARMEGRTIIQWDKYDLDYLGLLKVDVLSLGMLSALRKNLDMVGMQLYEIPAEDKKTYEMIQKADTVGTFQIESRAQMSMLGRLKPENFYDLVVEVAIVRPGPIVGKMVHPYLKRKRGIEPVVYPHPKLKEILGKTYGVPIFQEQVMKMAIELAGFTPDESDYLRRAIGAWRSSGSINEIGQKLVNGLMKSGLSKEFAHQVFDQIKGFAQYGFPESHAASFALLAYASCYLKCHYPGEFACSIVNSQPMGFYANHTLIDDAKRHGVKVLPLHPDYSEWDCKMEGKAIRLGYRIVKGLAQEAAERIASQKPYVTLEDFLKKNRIRPDVLQRLAIGDYFEKFGLDPRHALWFVLDYNMKTNASQSQQLSLFNKKSEDPDGELFRSHTVFESVRADYDAYNLSAHQHPMAALRSSMKLPPLTSEKLRNVKPGTTIQSAGLVIIKQRPPTAKGVTFATLEDEYGFIDTIIHAEVYQKYYEHFSDECFLLIKGNVQRDGNTVSILVKSVAPILKPQGEEDLHIKPTQYYWG
jgi:error-prone DNA polymerase